MGRIQLVVAALVALALCAGGANAGSAAYSVSPTNPDESAITLTDMERDILRVCEGVLRLFAEHAEDIWLGYDLARQPFMVYVPERWALLLSSDSQATGFEVPPQNWPDIGTGVWYRQGQVGNLVGQLAFGYDAGGVQTVAIGFPESLPATFEDLELKMLGYIVHEAFHEYQNQAFGDIEWAREQEYPVEDVENSALAYLEMATLVEAVEAAWADDADLAGEAAAQFVAVRGHRWARADSFISIYEGGKETREGTARYVELRCLDLARGLDYESSVTGATPLTEALGGASLPGSLLDDFRDSMVDGAIPIEDLPRNRIYPVASAQGFLLDFFAVVWKPEVERSTVDFAYAPLLGESLYLTEADYPALLEAAKARHGYEGLVEAAASAIADHRAAYDGALAAFESQPGVRVEIAFNANGLYRSRSTSATRLVVDRGARELCGRYDVYTLERDETFFELHDVGLLEVNDYAGYGKTIVFMAPGITVLALDGEESAVSSEEGLALDDGAYNSRQFTSIRFAGNGFELTHEGSGTLSVDPQGITIDLTGE